MRFNWRFAVTLIIKSLEQLEQIIVDNLFPNTGLAYGAPLAAGNNPHASVGNDYALRVAVGAPLAPLGRPGTEKEQNYFSDIEKRAVYLARTLFVGEAVPLLIYHIR